MDNEPEPQRDGRGLNTTTIQALEQATNVDEGMHDLLDLRQRERVDVCNECRERGESSAAVWHRARVGECDECRERGESSGEGRRLA
eukprot:3606617-Prymnesium_polylepis.1